MINKFWFRIMKSIALFAVKWAYAYVDADHDGKISMQEIKDLTNSIKKIISN